jgi:hypothetical protein
VSEADASAPHPGDSTIAAIANKSLGLSVQALPRRLRGQGWQYCGPATLPCRCGRGSLHVFQQVAAGGKVATVCDRCVEVLTLDGIKGKYRNRVLTVTRREKSAVSARPKPLPAPRSSRPKTGTKAPGFLGATSLNGLVKSQLGFWLEGTGTIQDGPGWRYLGASGVICSECPLELTVCAHADGQVAAVCPRCRQAWSASEFDTHTARLLRDSSAALGTAEDRKAARSHKSAESKNTRVRPTSKRCSECLKEKPVGAFPERGRRCYDCGGQDRGSSVRALSGGLPSLGRRSS